MEHVPVHTKKHNLSFKQDPFNYIECTEMAVKPLITNIIVIKIKKHSANLQHILATNKIHGEL